MICRQIKEIGLMCRSSSSAALHFHTSMNVQMPLLLRTEIYKNSLLNRVHFQKEIACNNIHLMLNHMIKSLNITIMPALTHNNAGEQQHIYVSKYTSAKHQSRWKDNANTGQSFPSPGRRVKVGEQLVEEILYKGRKSG